MALKMPAMNRKLGMPADPADQAMATNEQALGEVVRKWLGNFQVRSPQNFRLFTPCIPAAMRSLQILGLSPS